MPMRTTDEEVIYSRDVGGHNIMKIKCNLHRKSLSPEEQKGCRRNSGGTKIILQKVQKRPWNGMGGL